MGLKLSPKTISRINEIWQMASSNKTMQDLFKKLDGCNTTDAYIILKNLEDNELKVLAALIGQANAKFER